MALRIRLARAGAKKRPYYLIVVADARSPRDGRFLERLGSYNPMLPKDHADRLKLVEERIKHWLSVGAQPTDRVTRFLGDKGLIALTAKSHNPIKAQPKKKAQERIKEREDKIAAAKAAAEEAAAAARAAEEEAKAAAEAAAAAEAQVEEAAAQEAPEASAPVEVPAASETSEPVAEEDKE